MSPSSIRDRMLIDGLMINNWGPEVFADMQKGGVTAVNATCSVWEDFRDSIKNIADWKVWFREWADHILQVYTTEDILRAQREGRVGVALGWQNSSGFGDYLPNIPLYAELGLKIVQLTYNTANSVGCGCYETNDGGLTDFGREVLAELNRCSILVDLSHVGPKTSSEAIKISEQPVAYTHVAPAAFYEHPRNKTDDQFREIADHGGFIGVTMFPTFMPNGSDSTLDEYLESVEHVMTIVGADRVGIGSDSCERRTEQQRYFTAHDKGHARKLVNYGEIRMPDDLNVAGFSGIVRKMESRGWEEELISKIAGQNWFNFLKEVWGA